MTIEQTPQYRFYGFGNYYLSSLQQGLQAGHAVTELFVNHDVSSEKYQQVNEWGKNHKTMVLLKGGNSADLADLFNFFKTLDEQGMPYAYTKFHEDEQSLGGALTYVGIVLPNEIYDLASKLRSKEVDLQTLVANLPAWKVELIQRLNWYGLAN